MLKGYGEYKNTNYDWLPRIPAHWKWIYLSQSCKEQCIKNSEDKENKVLSLSYGNIIIKKDINFGLVPKEYSGYQIVDKGNIILRLTDLQNDHTSLRTGLVKERGIITSAYTCLKLYENPNYLQYLLYSYDTQKVFYGMGGGVRQSIGFKEIRNMNVPLPPRSEQDQIVRYLDWKVSMINKYINAKKKKIELLKERKQAIINQAVTKGLDPKVPLKDSGIEWLEKIPAHWETRKLKTCGLMKSGINLTSYEIENEDKYPVYGGNGLRGYYKYFNRSGDYLLIGRQGALCGNVHKVSGEFWATEHAVVVEPYKSVNLNWYYYMLIVMNLNQYSESAAQPGLSVENIKNLKTGVPPFEEQKTIAVYVDNKINRMDDTVKNIKGKITLIQEYRTRLISDVVTGKVNVQNIKVPEFAVENDGLSNAEQKREGDVIDDE